MSAVTDPNRIKKDDPGNPDICMVAYYHKLFSKDNLETICDECKKGHRGCVDCKKELTKNIIKHLEPIRERRKYYEAHKDEVQKILQEGTNKVRKITKETMRQVKEAMKINYFEE